MWYIAQVEQGQSRGGGEFLGLYAVPQASCFSSFPNGVAFSHQLDGVDENEDEDAWHF